MEAAAFIPAAPAPGLNPLFIGVPTFDWHLSWIPGQMAQRHAALWRNDNDENAITISGLFGGEGMTHTIHHGGENHDYQLLPRVRGGFFIVNMHGVDGGPPLPLAFNQYNLYYAGFRFENRWYFFKDAELEGSGHDDPRNQDYWRRLPFGGGYSGDMIFNVKIGVSEMFEGTYETLVHLRNNFGDSNKVEKAMFRIIVVLPEAWRFPEWNERVHDIFNSYASIAVDSRDAPHVITFDYLFHNWQAISKRLMTGPNEFPNYPALLRFANYHEMIPVISVLNRHLL